jgi:hypothetical protein
MTNATVKWHYEQEKKANPDCKTCKGHGVVDIDDFIISYGPIYAACPGCIDNRRPHQLASGKPVDDDIPWTPKNELV